ncbi:MULTISPECIES: hypothetical protein [Haloferax]|uniref:Uncharacterized protein n=2 Tax=Haloferax TaxID=2251 RepID=A0A6G1Z1S7_9EURY|nr:MULTISPECIES: hypothetical protein [Haloferax]KAB1187825.1 hypothetical protein Hfx1149_07180 [Haloferax sp. CBA1149]MRW80486.1 hypothetical protein [Haloferax marinisediminis]
MSLKSALGSVFGLFLLAVAGLSVLVAASLVGVSLLSGLTELRIVGVMCALGTALIAGFSGYFVRKAVAGQVMPSNFDVSVAYRSGP